MVYSESEDRPLRALNVGPSPYRGQVLAHAQYGSRVGTARPDCRPAPRSVATIYLASEAMSITKR